MSEKINILFEITDNETIVITLGSDKKVMTRTDITGKDVEKEFVTLLKKIKNLPSEKGTNLQL